MNDEQLSHPRSMDPAENAPAPNMSQRAVMQVLSVEDWKIVALLPIPVGEILLKRIHEYGWMGRDTRRKIPNRNQAHPVRTCRDAFCPQKE
jgi:hypothetical protein